LPGCVFYSLIFGASSQRVARRLCFKDGEQPEPAARLHQASYRDWCTEQTASPRVSLLCCLNHSSVGTFLGCSFAFLWLAFFCSIYCVVVLQKEVVFDVKVFIGGSHVSGDPRVHHSLSRARDLFFVALFLPSLVEWGRKTCVSPLKYMYIARVHTDFPHHAHEIRLSARLKISPIQSRNPRVNRFSLSILYFS